MRHCSERVTAEIFLGYSSAQSRLFHRFEGIDRLFVEIQSRLDDVCFIDLLMYGRPMLKQHRGIQHRESEMVHQEMMASSSTDLLCVWVCGGWIIVNAWRGGSGGGGGGQVS